MRAAPWHTCCSPINSNWSAAGEGNAHGPQRHKGEGMSCMCKYAGVCGLPLSLVLLLFTCTIGGDRRHNTNGGVDLEDDKDSMSYIIGRDVGSQLKDLEVDLRIEPFVQGIEHARSGRSSLIDTVAADSLRRQFALAAQERLEEQQRELAARQKEEGEEFLARNREKPGVKATESGLQYEVLEQGRGPKPERGDSVLVEYTGMLVDGTVFDSAGTPVVLDLQRTIPGLTEGILMMKVGSQYRFYLPPELAFGAEGIPPLIPPNAVLIFDVELVNIGGQQKASLR